MPIPTRRSLHCGILPPLRSKEKVNQFSIKNNQLFKVALSYKKYDERCFKTYLPLATYEHLCRIREVETEQAF